MLISDTLNFVLRRPSFKWTLVSYVQSFTLNFLVDRILNKIMYEVLSNFYVNLIIILA